MGKTGWWRESWKLCESSTHIGNFTIPFFQSCSRLDRTVGVRVWRSSTITSWQAYRRESGSSLTKPIILIYFRMQLWRVWVLEPELLHSSLGPCFHCMSTEKVLYHLHTLTDATDPMVSCLNNTNNGKAFRKMPATEQQIIISYSWLVILHCPGFDPQPKFQHASHKNCLPQFI